MKLYILVLASLLYYTSHDEDQGVVLGQKPKFNGYIGVAVNFCVRKDAVDPSLSLYCRGSNDW